MKKSLYDLTPKQEGFCQDIASGMTGADAYRKNYNTNPTYVNSIYTQASKLKNNPKIKIRIEEILNESDKSIHLKNKVGQISDYIKLLEKKMNKEDNGHLLWLKNDLSILKLKVEDLYKNFWFIFERKTSIIFKLYIFFRGLNESY